MKETVDGRELLVLVYYAKKIVTKMFRTSNLSSVMMLMSICCRLQRREACSLSGLVV